MALSCLLCCSSVVPGNRVFLKQKGELVKSVLSCLNYQDNVEAERFCENQVVCRGKCMGTLNRLVKLRKELTGVEKEVMEKIGPAVESHLLSNEHINDSPRLAGARLRSSATAVTPRRKLLKQMVSHGSPVVSVSTCCNNIKPIIRFL